MKEIIISVDGEEVRFTEVGSSFLVCRVNGHYVHFLEEIEGGYDHFKTGASPADLDQYRDLYKAAVAKFKRLQAFL